MQYTFQGEHLSRLYNNSTWLYTSCAQITHRPDSHVKISYVPMPRAQMGMNIIACLILTQPRAGQGTLSYSVKTRPTFLCSFFIFTFIPVWRDPSPTE